MGEVEQLRFEFQNNEEMKDLLKLLFASSILDYLLRHIQDMVLFLCCFKQNQQDDQTKISKI